MKKTRRKIRVPKGLPPANAARKNTFLNTLIRNNFKVNKTLRDTNIPSSTYYTWLNDDPDFLACVEATRKQTIDMIEDAFKDLIKERNPQVVMFGLKTLGAKRGYQEKKQIEHFGQGGVELHFHSNRERKEEVIDITPKTEELE